MFDGCFQAKPFCDSVFILFSQFGLGQEEADMLVLLSFFKTQEAELSRQQMSL